MKIEIDCGLLSNELAKIKPILSSRTSFPILQNVLMIAEEPKNGEDEGSLTLRATDTDIFISIVCPCKVISPGQCAVKADTLQSSLNTMKNSSVVIEKGENNWMMATSLTNSKDCFKITGTHPSDFPKFRELPEELFDIEPRLLYDMMRRTSFARSNDDARAYLTGAFLRLMPDRKLTMVATDAHRFAKYETESNEFVLPKIVGPIHEGIIIPGKGITLLSSIFKNSDLDSCDLSFGLSQKEIIFFKYETTTISMRLVAGSFPNYQSVLPSRKSNPPKAVINRQEFIEALKFVQIFASQKSNIINLYLTKGDMHLHAQHPERGECDRHLAVEYDGEPRDGQFNYKFLGEILTAMDDLESITMSIDEGRAPAVLRDFEDPERLIYLVMPLCS